MGGIRGLLAAGWLALVATDAFAVFHTFKFQQLYSNADGTVQFIVMHESELANGEHLWKGNVALFVTQDGVTKVYPFTSDLANRFTAGKYALIATPGFAALGLIQPDYIFPNGFLGTGPTTVSFGSVDQIAYTSLPVDGVNARARDGSVVKNLARNFAGESVSLTLAGPPAPPAAANYQGLWWNAPAESESGWGINFTHQGDTIFGSWFTFDLDGSPLWMVVAAPKIAEGVYSGSLARGTGPAYNAVPFDPAQVVGTLVGTATFTFADESNASFAYTIGDVTQTKSITRQIFGNPVPACTWDAQADPAAATNYQDLWWAAPAGSESGWGINFTHQGDTIFGTWFTYGLDGKPLWMVVSANKTAPGVYAGALYRGTGPAWNAVPFDPAQVVPVEVGTATFTFADGKTASFAYTIDGESQTKTIMRQVFGTASALCQ